jgi:hypothetical protein
MKQPSDLTREELEGIALQIRDILWRDPVTGRLDPERSWTVETIERVSGVIEDAGLKPERVPQEQLPVENNRWERILAVPGGHRYFREKATGKVAVADDSGGWPEECDGGPLFVDTGSPLGPDRAWTFAVPLVGGGIAMAGADEAAGLIRHLQMRIEWPSTIREAVAAGAGDPAGLRAALEAFIRTIEATGGIVQPCDGGLAYPRADIDWIDLAGAYQEACAAMGREPMFVDGEDDDETADDEEGADEA